MKFCEVLSKKPPVFSCANLRIKPEWNYLSLIFNKRKCDCVLRHLGEISQSPELRSACDKSDPFLSWRLAFCSNRIWACPAWVLFPALPLVSAGLQGLLLPLSATRLTSRLCSFRGSKSLRRSQQRLTLVACVGIWLAAACTACQGQ